MKRQSLTLVSVNDQPVAPMKEDIPEGAPRILCADPDCDSPEMESTIFRIKCEEGELVMCFNCLMSYAELCVPGEITILKIYEHDEDTAWIDSDDVN